MLDSMPLMRSSSVVLASHQKLRLQRVVHHMLLHSPSGQNKGMAQSGHSRDVGFRRQARGEA